MTRPKCKCGNLCKKSNKSKVDGRQLYCARCSTCSKKAHKQGTPGARGGVDKSNERRLRRFIYEKFKKTFCEKCGFVAEDPCQLDVDHKDGDSKNHDESNLQTLCANCHRLKTKRERDFVSS